MNEQHLKSQTADGQSPGRKGRGLFPQAVMLLFPWGSGRDDRKCPRPWEMTQRPLSRAWGQNCGMWAAGKTPAGAQPRTQGGSRGA